MLVMYCVHTQFTQAGTPSCASLGSRPSPLRARFNCGGGGGGGGGGGWANQSSGKAGLG